MINSNMLMSHHHHHMMTVMQQPPPVLPAIAQMINLNQLMQIEAPLMMHQTINTLSTTTPTPTPTPIPITTPIPTLSSTNKIEPLPAGSKIMHPEEDISLEEIRARHSKYKYTQAQYSSMVSPAKISSRLPSSSSPKVDSSGLYCSNNNNTNSGSLQHYQNGNRHRY
jgi:hypothetical protein